MDGLVECQFRDLAGNARIGKADRAGHVAAVGQVDLPQAGGRLVLVAQAAIGGAMGPAGDVGLFEPGRFFKAPPGGLGVEGGVAVDAIAHVAVLGAGLFDMDGAVFDEDSADNHGAAVRAERFDGPRQTAMQRPNPAAVVGCRGAAGDVAGQIGPDRIVMDLPPGAAVGAVEGEHDLSPDPLEGGGPDLSAGRAGRLGRYRQRGETVGKAPHGRLEGGDLFGSHRHRASGPRAIRARHRTDHLLGRRTHAVAPGRTLTSRPRSRPGIGVGWSCDDGSCRPVP